MRIDPRDYDYAVSIGNMSAARQFTRNFFITRDLEVALQMRDLGQELILQSQNTAGRDQLVHGEGLAAVQGEWVAAWVGPKRPESWVEKINAVGQASTTCCPSKCDKGERAPCIRTSS